MVSSHFYVSLKGYDKSPLPHKIGNFDFYTCAKKKKKRVNYGQKCSYNNPRLPCGPQIALYQLTADTLPLPT